MTFLWARTPPHFPIHLAGLGAALLAMGCGVQVVGESCDLLVGDLVISEVMPNPLSPAGTSDRSYEWFEIYNASSRPQVLNRLYLVHQKIRANGEVEERRHHVRGAGTIQPGQYYVMGDGPTREDWERLRDAAAAAGDVWDHDYTDHFAPLDYSYGSDYHAMNLAQRGDNLSDLNNATGTFPEAVLALVCNNRIIDAVRWGKVDEAGLGMPAPQEGFSLTFGGSVAPDAILNDRALGWCSGGEQYDAMGNIGSPGKANLPCGAVRCQENGEYRDGALAQPGEVLVSEVLMDPFGSSDNNKYWVELYINAERPVDLNGITIVTQGGGAPPNEAIIDMQACVRGQPGDYVVIGASADRSANDDVPVDGVARNLRFSTPFKNSGGVITLRRYDMDTNANIVLDTAVLPPRKSDQSGRSPRQCREGEAGIPYLDQDSCELRPNPDTGALDPDRPSGCTWDAENESCGGGVTKYSGRSLGFDGPALQLAEAPLLNDRAAAFCYAPDSEDQVYYGGIGSPGAPNARCGTVACEEGDVLRPTRIPAPGDLILTEIYNDPKGADRSKEWVELFAARDVDLNGLSLRGAKVSSAIDKPSWVSTAPASSDQCLAASEGQHVVASIYYEGDLGQVIDNSGVSPLVVLPTTRTTGALTNVRSTDADHPRLRVEIWWGDELLDGAEVEGPQEGTSATLKPGNLHVSLNDLPENWCAPKTGGLFEGLGTPGFQNFCVPACLEPQGSLREVEWPQVGHLVITEFLSNATGADAGQEWIEVYNLAGASFDLNGLTVRSTSSSGNSREQIATDKLCAAVAPGTYAVLGGVNSEGPAGPFTPHALFGAGTSELLYNTGSTHALLAGEVLLDATAALTGAEARSQALDPAVLNSDSPTLDNDDAAVWVSTPDLTPGCVNIPEECTP